MSYGKYPDLSGVKKILVIKLRHLGDVLLTTPVFYNLKKHLPQAKIDTYVYDEAKEILEDNPYVDEVISHRRSWKKMPFLTRFKNELQLLLAFRKKRYDLVINMTEGDRGAIVTQFSKAKIKVGYDVGSKKKKKIYHYRAKPCPGNRHMVERSLDILRIIGIFPGRKDRQLYFSTPKKQLIEKPYILIHPASRWRFKCWPAEKVKQLIQKLNQQVVVVSGPDPIEKERVKEIIRGTKALDLSGKVSIKELASLIYFADCTLCMDSMCFHLANSLKARVVALFGPTSDVNWGAWENPKATVLTQDLPCRPCYMDGCAGSKFSDCLATLEVEKVLNAITESPRQSKSALPLYCSKDHR